jgi:magnesium transporter
LSILEGLDTEQASDTLEEIDPAVQRDIVFSLRKERVAQRIGEMTSGQAADILAVLPAAEKENNHAAGARLSLQRHVAPA